MTEQIRKPSMLLECPQCHQEADCEATLMCGGVDFKLNFKCPSCEHVWQPEYKTNTEGGREFLGLDGSSITVGAR